MKRVCLIVLDGVGVGATPDAGEYQDLGTNTLAHVEAASPLNCPTLQSLGLGNILSLKSVPPTQHPQGAWGRLQEQSVGKDSITGHWELAGVITTDPFPTYPKGFPDEILIPFKKEIDRNILGNKAASGTEIIKELGEQHLKTGAPIVYTSVDSVFQIAAHEEVIPIEELYQICETARKVLTPPHHMSRVIARPFTGKPGEFVRTHRRKDFSLDPTGTTFLDLAVENGLETLAIGKTADLFNYRSTSQVIRTENDEDGMEKTLIALEKKEASIIFTNLVDFDSKYGHRNDAKGFAQNLERFDRSLAKALQLLSDEDILIITADHGCDPTFTNHTDHTREHVPLLITGPPIQNRIDLGTRQTLADIGQTICTYLDLPKLSNGTSVL